MTRKKVIDPILQAAGEPYDDTGIVSIPSDEDAILTSKKDAAKLRTVSAAQCAVLLGHDRGTIQKWISQGCPFVTQANRALGIAWQLDLAEVVKWREEAAAKTAAERFGETPDGQMTEEEAKRRRAAALAIVAELDMLERLRAVIPVSDVLEWWAKDYQEIKAKAMSFPDKLATAFDPAQAAHVRSIADEHMREMMGLCKTRQSLLKWSEA